MTRSVLSIFWLWLLVPVMLPAQADPRAADFKNLATQLIERRLNGSEETEELQEKTLAIIDKVVLEELNRGSARDLATLNGRLRSFVINDPPIGESYVVILVGTPVTGPGYYALVANFSQSGPSAVRLYPPSAGGYRLAARIDRFAQKEFFDEYLELVPIKSSDLVFVTVMGRTDELKTGAFTAWRFHDGRLDAVWESELLEHSSYEARPDGFRVTFCAQADAQNPRRCAKFARERYLWNGAAWQRAAREELAPKQ